MYAKRRTSVKIISNNFADDLERNLNRALDDIYENANDPKIIDIKFDNLIAMIIYEWSDDPRSEAEKLPE